MSTVPGRFLDALADVYAPVSGEAPTASTGAPSGSRSMLGSHGSLDPASRPTIGTTTANRLLDDSFEAL